MFLEKLIDGIEAGQHITDVWLVEAARPSGKVLAGSPASKATEFSDAVKSEAFINTALAGALKCNICNGYLDPEKSLSYDHDTRRSEGGTGAKDNLRLTHPYCNQGLKA